MDEYTADVFSNRDNAIPVVAASSQEPMPSKTRRKMDKVKASLPIASHTSNESEGEGHGRSIQDRLFARYVASGMQPFISSNEYQPKLADSSSRLFLQKT